MQMLQGGGYPTTEHSTSKYGMLWCSCLVCSAGVTEKTKEPQLCVSQIETLTLFSLGPTDGKKKKN